MSRNRQHTTAVSMSIPTYERDVTVVATAVDLVISLPPAGSGTKGNTVRVVAGIASTVTGLSLSPAASDKIQGTGITAADDKDLINTAATDAVGDCLEVVCDGVDGWWITGKIGTWARQA